MDPSDKVHDDEPAPPVRDWLTEGPEGDRPMSFFEHLAELRTRLIRATVGVALAFVVAWLFRTDLQAILNRPLYEAWQALVEAGRLSGPPRLQTLGVLDAFLTQVRIAVTAALFLAGPVVFYELWMFVAPGLYPSEKKLVVPFVATSAVMFVLGAAFCYGMVLPFATEWFLAYPLEEGDGSGVQIVPQYTFPDYTTYTTKLLLGFGLMFEMPLAVFFLAKVGLVTHETLLRFWKVAVLVIFLASAFLTPPDPITLMFMAVPMVGLFFFSVLVAYLVAPKDAGNPAAAPAPEPAAAAEGRAEPPSFPELAAGDTAPPQGPDGAA